MARFDEIDLIKDKDSPAGAAKASEPVVAEFPARARPFRVRTAAGEVTPTRPASLLNRSLALVTDLSLFVALALALSPLLPPGNIFGSAAIPAGAMALFLVLLSYYYFALSWLIWGRTVGGSIFETRVIQTADGVMDLGSASRRWAGTLLSVLTAGLGFIPALFPGHRSLADRMSGTRCVAEETEEEDDERGVGSE